MAVYQYIKTETDSTKLYDGIRAILREMDKRGRYPEDWEIKTIQRIADARAEELREREEKERCATI